MTELVVRGTNPFGFAGNLTRLVLLTLLAAAAGCSKPAPEDVASEAVVPVTVAVAETGRITGSIHATGLVTPAPGAELIVVAPEPARVVEIPKAEGDTVRRGDVLVRFEIPSSLAEASKQRAEIGRAEARLTNAQAAEARMKDLLARGVAARKQLEDATREVADAQADLAGAQAAATAADTIAARSVVRASFDGVVARRLHNPGDLVEAVAGDPVLRVIDPRHLELAAQVAIGDAPRVKVGASARVAGAPSGTPPSALSVVSRPAAVQEGMATVLIRLAFKVAADYPVGTPLQVDIEAETHSGVVLVPASALVREGEGTSVFVTAGEKAQRRGVTVGLSDGERVEILSGVKAGEQVIISNQNGLPDDAAITVAQPVAPGVKDGAGQGEP